MDFQIAEKQYQILKNQLESGKISPQLYAQKIESLRFQTPNGVWWQLDGTSGTWLRYNGQVWAPYTPSDYMGPKTLNALLIMLIKNLPRTLFKSIQRKLMFALIAGVGVLVVHTILLIGPNGGFAPSNAFYNNILSLQGRVVTGTLFWMIATGVLLSTYYRIKSIGFKAFQDTIANTFKDYIYVVPKMMPPKASPYQFIFILSAALAMAYTLFNNDHVLSILIAIWLTLAVAAGIKSFTYLVLKLAASDIKRILKARVPFNKRNLEIGFYGAITSLLCASAVMQLPFNRFIRIGLVIALIALAVTKKPNVSLTTFFLLCCTSFTALSSFISHADDGGWSEAGGTLAGWVQSEGAVIAIMMGVPPAVGTAIAIGLLDSIIDILMNGLNDLPEVDWDGQVVPPIPVVPVVPVAPVVPVVPVVPPVEPPVTPIKTEPGKTPEELEQIKAKEEKAAAEKKRKEAEQKRKEKELEAQKKKTAEEKRKAEEEQKRAEAEQKRIEKEKKIAELRIKQAKLEAESEAANNSAWWWDVGTKAVEGVQKVSDISIDILATVTGPAGQRIKNLYTFGKAVGKAAGESVADGGKNFGSKLLEGTVNGAYDVLKGKAMDKLGGIANNKIPGLKSYGPGDNVGEIWKKGRVGFMKDALIGKNTHSTVSNMVRDQFTEGVKNAAQSQVQSELTGPIDNTVKGWVSKARKGIFG